MRTLILSALLLAAAAPVLAQMPPPDARDEQRGDHRDQGQRPDDRGGYQGQRPDDRGPGQRPDDRGGYPGQRPDDRGYHGDNRGYGGDNRGYRGDDHGGYRNDFRDDRRGYGGGDSFARFHGGSFFYPRGYGYRYYGIGSFLPRVFWSQRYYIADPYAYRLPPAFAGTRWVRVGPDALLIRLYDGRVVRVIQGLFY